MRLFMYKQAGIFILSICLLFLVACTQIQQLQQERLQTTTTTPIIKTTTTTSITTTTQTTKQIQDYVTEGLSIVVNGFQQKDTIGICTGYGFDCDKPQKKYVFVIIDVTIENVGQTSDYIYPGILSLKDADGYTYTSAWTSHLDGELPSMQLEPGKIIRGKVAFEIPKGKNFWLYNEGEQIEIIDLI
jgi:hypothetical protein